MLGHDRNDQGRWAFFRFRNLSLGAGRLRDWNGNSGFGWGGPGSRNTYFDSRTNRARLRAEEARMRKSRFRTEQILLALRQAKPAP